MVDGGWYMVDGTLWMVHGGWYMVWVIISVSYITLHTVRTCSYVFILNRKKLKFFITLKLIYVTVIVSLSQVSQQIR